MTRERKPRAHFTKKLYKILQVLDESAERTFEFNDALSFEATRYGRARATVLKVWVYGSYARGAATCGDLDVLVEYLTEKVDGSPRNPEARHVIQAFWRGVREVQFNAGRPEGNSTHVKVPGALLIWQQGLDWRAALDGIKEDPSAGRFQRVTDKIPADFHRFGIDIGTAQDYGYAVEAGLLKMSWMPFRGDGLEASKWRSDEARAALALGFQRGLELQAVLPHLMGALRGQQPGSGRSPARWAFDDRNMLWDGREVEIGRHHGHPNRFARDKRFKGYVLVPYLKKSGPNGVLLVDRGETPSMTWDEFKEARREREEDRRREELGQLA